MTFEERCRLSEQCLPEAPYRMLLTNLHNEMLGKLAEQPPQRKPLTDEEILYMCTSVPDYDIGNHDLIQFARAIEAAHGIKENT